MRSFKYLAIISLFYFLMHPCCSQNISLSLNASYGTYNMKSMKGFQNELYNDVSSSIDVPFKITDDFPGFIGYELTAKLPQENFFYGLQLAFRSTGGRIAYADYSGKYKVDNDLVVFEAVGTVGINLYKRDHLFLNILGHMGAAYTQHELSSIFQLTGFEAESDLYEFYSLNVVLAVGTEAQYFLWENIFFRLNVRYDLHIPGELLLKENTEAFLQNSAGSPVKVNWSGARVGLGVGYRF